MSCRRSEIFGEEGVWYPRSMEYKGEGIDPARPHSMVPFTYALQTIRTYLNKKYLSDVQMPCTCIQNS